MTALEAVPRPLPYAAVVSWLDDQGETHERIYDVAVSDGREIGADGRAREVVGNTVDISRATYTNTIGDAVLSAHWTDPEFDPKQHAFYYVRVLEIPTPRWTTYDAVCPTLVSAKYLKRLVSPSQGPYSVSRLSSTIGLKVAFISSMVKKLSRRGLPQRWQAN